MDEESTLPSRVEYLAQTPEYRQARGKRHPRQALVLLVCVALLCGARGPSAIADGGRYRGQPWRRRRGCTRRRGPSQATLRRLFQAVPHATVEAVLGRWAAQVRRRCPPGAAGDREGSAMDGQRLRGRAKPGAVDAPLLAAFSHRRKVVLGQVGVPDKTTEIGAAGALRLGLVLEGRVVTADALLTQREVARTILASGGDDLLAVQEHPPQRHADSVATFAPAADDTGLRGVACTVDAHGGRVEPRRLVASAALVGSRDWPGRRQALMVERRVLHQATGRLRRQEVAYAVTSCAPHRATPAQLLALWRGHGGVEKQRHYLRDVPFDEDRATVRAGHAPQVLAACRNAALGLLRRRGAANLASACRLCAARPAVALAAVGLTDFE